MGHKNWRISHLPAEYVDLFRKTGTPELLYKFVIMNFEICYRYGVVLRHRRTDQNRYITLPLLC